MGDVTRVMYRAMYLDDDDDGDDDDGDDDAKMGSSMSTLIFGSCFGFLKWNP